MNIKTALFGAALAATLGYAGHSCMQTNEGYENIRNSMKLADRVEKHGENLFEPGREKFAEWFHTINPTLDRNYFEEKAPRTSQGIEDGAGYLQLGALGALGIGIFVGLYRGLIGKK